MPTPTYGGKLIVEAYHWGYIQIYIPDSPENLMYIRKLYTYDNNEWTNWEIIITGTKNRTLKSSNIEYPTHETLDLNNLITYNAYFINTDINTCTNMPTIEYGYLYVTNCIYYANTRILQTYIGDNSNKIWMRENFNSEWKDWKLIYPDYSNKYFSSNGYIVFTNGLIIQWGAYNNDRQASIEITLPINFNTANYIYIFSPGADYYPVYLTALSRTINSFNISFVNAENEMVYGNWITIGW